MRHGGDRTVVEAVYDVKRLNALVTLQLDAVHNGDPEAVGRIPGFVFAADQWEPVCKAIRTLLRFAQDAGNDMTNLGHELEAEFAKGEVVRKVLGL